MGLRHHSHADDESVSIDVASLLHILSQKTSNAEIKTKIINELLDNSLEYPLDAPEEYEALVDKAFEKAVSEIKAESSRILEETKEELSKKYDKDNELMKQELEKIGTEETHITLIAQKRASRNVGAFKRLSTTLQFPLLVVSFLIFAAVIYLYICKVEPFYTFCKDNSDFAFWAIGIILALIPQLITGWLKHMSSKERKEKLVKKYRKDLERDLKSTANDD
jgi:hypothetical protein